MRHIMRDFACFLYFSGPEWINPLSRVFLVLSLAIHGARQSWADVASTGIVFVLYYEISGFSERVESRIDGTPNIIIWTFLVLSPFLDLALSFPSFLPAEIIPALPLEVHLVAAPRGAWSLRPR